MRHIYANFPLGLYSRVQVLSPLLQITAPEIVGEILRMFCNIFASEPCFLIIFGRKWLKRPVRSFHTLELAENPFHSTLLIHCFVHSADAVICQLHPFAAGQ